MIAHYTLSPTINIIQALTLTAILLAVAASIIGASKKAIKTLLATIALLHAAYITIYIHTYNLKLKLYPFLDMLVGPRGPSLIIDLAQISIALIILLTLLERKARRENNINQNIT